MECCFYFIGANSAVTNAIAFVWSWERLTWKIISFSSFFKIRICGHLFSLWKTSISLYEIFKISSAVNAFTTASFAQNRAAKWLSWWLNLLQYSSSKGVKTRLRKASDFPLNLSISSISTPIALYWF